MSKIHPVCECGHFESSHAAAETDEGPRPCKKCSECYTFYYDYQMSKDMYDEAMERRYREG
jgi:hypothetical protein